MCSQQLFEKNLQIFQRFCPKLEKKVRSSKSSDYCSFFTKQGDLNLKITSKNFHFHSDDSKREADLWWNTLSNIDRADLLVVFGVGLGVYYDALKPWLKKNADRLVFFIEFDFCLLHFFFQTEKAQRLLSDPQVGIIGVEKTSIDTVAAFLGPLEIIALLMSERRTVFTELKSYQVYSGFWKKIKTALQFHAREAVFLSNFLMPKTFQEHVINTRDNLWKIPISKLIYPLKDCLKGIPAIVCGAGPSLLEDLPDLKLYQDRALIFAAGTAMNILNKHAIFPPLGVVMDPYTATKNRILTNYSYMTPFCFKLSVQHEALRLLHGSLLFFRGYDSYGLETFLEKQLGLNDYPRIHSPLTTTHAACGVAAFLGCRPIILLGVDLSYTQRQRYPEEVQDHPLQKPSIHHSPDSLAPNAVILARATNGERVETRADWIREAALFEKFYQKNPEYELINATSHGLLLKGVPHKPLAEVAKEKLTVSYDLENLIYAQIENCPKSAITKKQIADVISVWKEEVEKALQTLSAIVQELNAISIELQQNPDSFLTKTPKLQKLEDTLQKSELYQSVFRSREKQFGKIFFSKRYLYLYRKEAFQENKQAITELDFKRGVYLYITYCASLMQSCLAEVFSEKKRFFDDDQGFCYDRLGQIKTECFYQKGKLHGPTTVFGANGKILAKGRFVEGKRQGKNYQYYASQALFSVQRYQKGLRHGVQQYFYESQKEKARLIFFKGNLDGKVILYYPSGRIRREIHFKKGRLHGFEKMWTDEGILLMEVEYQEGTPIGISRCWYQSGQIKEIKKFYDTPDHFDLSQFSEEGEVIKKSVYLPKDFGQRLETPLKSLRRDLQRIKDVIKKIEKNDENI